MTLGLETAQGKTLKYKTNGSEANKARKTVVATIKVIIELTLLFVIIYLPKVL